MHFTNHSCKLIHTLKRFYTTMSKKTLYVVLLPPSKELNIKYNFISMFSKNIMNSQKFIEKCRTTVIDAYLYTMIYVYSRMQARVK